MKNLKGIAGAFAGLATLIAAQAANAQEAAQPVQVMQQEASKAEKLKKLKIMLMVSSLRCRHGSDDFQPAYQRFATRHQPMLRGAHMEMQTNLSARYGARRGQRELDRAIVSMANEYGQGHPWLDCSGLAQVTSDLADFGGNEELLAAAGHLLGAKRRVAQTITTPPTIAAQAAQPLVGDQVAIVAARR